MIFLHKFNGRALWSLRTDILRTLVITIFVRFFSSLNTSIQMESQASTLSNGLKEEAPAERRRDISRI